MVLYLTPPPVTYFTQCETSFTVKEKVIYCSMTLHYLTTCKSGEKVILYPITTVLLFPSNHYYSTLV
jgi:hypothetical protein